MSIDSKFAINHFLRSKGMAGLSEAGPLISQLAYLVRDDRHFRSLLNACEPAERGHMYETMAPNLRFKARSLAEYMIENAQDAEARQLPTIGEDGQFKPFRVADIKTEPSGDDAIATAAVTEQLAKVGLEVTCSLCTRSARLTAMSKENAILALRRSGWRKAFKGKGEEVEQVEICPRCVKKRAPRIQAA